MMNLEMIIGAASMGACVLIYAFVGFVVITLMKHVVRGIVREAMEYKRTKDSVEMTEHVYHKAS